MTDWHFIYDSVFCENSNQFVTAQQTEKNMIKRRLIVGKLHQIPKFDLPFQWDICRGSVSFAMTCTLAWIEIYRYTYVEFLMK
jgi:hypothetical protein